ncbi:MAG: hypothetical protein PHN88_15945 [Ignavibacteria bacterium]|nr:hypothetical protein [Ignavibacteria bacterium]
MSASSFITLISQATTGLLGNLPRRIVFATRETITGYTPDANSGLIEITEAQVAAFAIANPTKYATNKFLETVYAGSAKPDKVYILSTGAGAALTSAMLDKANYSPRSWSFLTIGSVTNGLDDSVTFLADCVVASAWCTDAKAKIFFHSFSMIDGGTLPANLLLGGSLTTNSRTMTIVTNAHDEIDEYTDCYHNPLVAALAFVLYGGMIARSIGSLSDAHDFEAVDGDTYSATTRAYIASQSLSQYNGAKDQGEALFLYDTFLNSTVNPPTSMQIETQIAIDYINDYCVVSARNSLIAAGRTGIDADYPGVLEVAALIRSSLEALWKAGAILSLVDNSPAYNLIVKSKTEIDALNPAWQSQGVIPAGAIVASIQAYKAIHYFTIVFNFN